MYNLIYEGRKIRELVNKLPGPVWVSGFKEDGDTVHVCGDWVRSRVKGVTGPVWVCFNNGEYISEYSSNDKMVKLSVSESGFTDVAGVVYVGKDSGDALFILPDMTGLSGAKIVDDRFRVITRKTLSEEALITFGRLYYGYDFVHTKRSDLFHYPRSLKATDGDWILWSAHDADFTVIRGDAVEVVFQVLEDNTVLSDAGTHVLPVGIKSGTWSFKIPEAALDYTIQVTSQDVVSSELAVRADDPEDGYEEIEADTYALMVDSNARNDILSMVQELQDIIPDDKKDKNEYVLQGTLRYMLELLTDGKE